MLPLGSLAALAVASPWLHGRSELRRKLVVRKSGEGIQHEDDEDAPDSDATFPGEGPLDDGQFLPAANDSSQEFRLHAQQLLETFSSTRDFNKCLAFLGSLPAISPEITRLGPRSLLRRLERLLPSISGSNTTGADAVQVTIPYWLCHD